MGKRDVHLSFDMSEALDYALNLSMLIHNVRDQHQPEIIAKMEALQAKLMSVVDIKEELDDDKNGSRRID